MGRLKQGINGAIKGKIGAVVGITWRGEDYVRASPKPTTVPPSPAQLDQRMVFAFANAWIKPIRDIIWIGYQIFKGNKTPTNMMVSFLLKEAIVGTGVDAKVDYPKVVLSRGELIVSYILEILTLINAALHIKWNNLPASAFNKDDDKSTFVIYNPTKEQFVTFEDVAQRADKEVVLQMPKSFSGDVVHGWMHYVSREGNAVSTSVYLGEMVVG
ncbi:DUF6266 family protein [Pedobacter sp. PWIIR3]